MEEEYEQIIPSSFDESYYLQHQMQEENIKNNPNKQREKINLDSFNLLTIIGKGSYAKVALVQKKDNGKIYAMKILKKSYIGKRDQKNRVYEERNILESTNYQFVVQMNYAFQDNGKLFFILEFCPGGELYNILSKKKKFNEEQTKFYAAQIVLALEYLHSKNIVYRDLKPENILIDKQGYIKLTDFGLSKRNVVGTQDAKSICGTPEYLAPEILFKSGHGKPVDFWTLGSLITEMFTGFPPFHHQSRDVLFQKIKYEPAQFPSEVQGNLKDLLERLLQKQPSQRLGSQKGAEEIKNHPWFKTFNWEKLINREIEAPFVPILNNDTEVTYFDKEFIETPIYSPNSENLSLFEENYEKFTYEQGGTCQSFSNKKYSIVSGGQSPQANLEKDNKIHIENEHDQPIQSDFTIINFEDEGDQNSYTIVEKKGDEINIQ